MSVTVQKQIEKYIDSQPEAKRDDMRELQRLALQVSPASKLWFFDGKNSENKTVANPTVGFGSHLMKYADGTTKEYFQIGISANTGGISIHILGIKDKTYLAKTFGKKLGKASVTGYCVKFKSLKDVNKDALEGVIRYGFEAQKESK